MANTYIYLPGSGNGGPGGVKFTYSVWFKLAKDSGDSGLVSTNPGGQQSWDLWVNPIVKFKCYQSASLIGELVTKAKLRDVGAWYNIVVNIDFANVTESNRMKLWINGIQQTGSLLEDETYPGTSATVDSGGSVFNIGRYQASSDYFKGSMSHIHFYDGYAYDATDFGEFDATSGIWKIKTSGPSTTYGTYGFNVKMEDRTNLDLDSSSNALAFTTGGDLTATYDNPSNNFCTMNPLDNYWQSATFANGNNTMTAHAGNYTWNTATVGLTSGKWYWECKGGTNIANVIVAICSKLSPGSTTEITSDASSISMEMGSGNVLKGSVSQYSGTGYTTSNVCGIAMDLDNNKYYLALDNVWKNSGDPTSGATGTGAVSITTPIPNTGLYFPTQADPSSGVGGECFWNFGSGYFGTTAVTSAEADGAGIGAFEYAPPTGYYALCTKNIKAYGG